MIRRTAVVGLLLALCPFVSPASAQLQRPVADLPAPGVQPPPAPKETKPKPKPRSDKPPLVGQGKSVGTLLAAYRSFAARGSGTLAEFDEWFADTFGPKGFDGIDLNKPVGFYLRLTAEADDGLDYAWVYAVPITGKEAFLALLARADVEADEITGTPGGYEANMGGHTVCFAFLKGHVYLAVNGRPEDVDAKRLIDPAELIDEAENALVAVRGYPDRFPEGFAEAAATRASGVLTRVGGMFNDQADPAGTLVRAAGFDLAGAAVEEAVKRLLTDAESFTVRMTHDPDAGTFAFDASIRPKANTPLAVATAALTGGKHLFGSLAAAKDVAGGLFLHAPAGGGDRFPVVRKHLADGMEERKDDIPESLQEPVKALHDVLARTLKEGAPDAAVLTVGPDANGKFGTVYALGLADAAKLDPAFRTLLRVRPELLGDTDAVGKAVTLDADKVGAFPVHTVARRDLLPADTAAEVREKTDPLAVCFTDAAVLCAIGTDPVALLKRAAAAEPADVGAVRATVNPARALDHLKGLPRTEEDAVRASVNAYGDDDAERVQVIATVDGGKELRLRLTVDPAALRYQAERNPYWYYALFN